MPTDPFQQAAQARGATTPNTPAAVNPFEEAARSRQGYASTQLDAANDTTPEQAAGFRELAAITTLPYEFVRKNGEAVGKAVKQRRALAYLENAPILQRFISKPENAALSQDSLEALARIEGSIRGDKEPGLFSKTLSAAYLGFTKGTEASFAGAGAAALEGGPQALFPFSQEAGKVASGLADAAASVDHPLKGRVRLPGFGLRVRFPDATGGVFDEDVVSARAQRALDHAISVGEEIAARTPQGNNATEQAVISGGQSLGQMIPALFASFVTKNPNLGAGIMAAGTGGQSYTQAREQGLSHEDALEFAQTDAGIEFITEKIPLAVLLDRTGGKSLVSRFAKSILSEQVSEQAATILQDANAWARLNPDKTLNEFIAERPGAAYQTAIATLVASGPINAAYLGVEGLVGGAQEKQAAAEGMAENLTALRDAVEQAPLMQRDKQAMQEFLSEATEGQTIELDPQGLETLYQSDPAAYQQIAEDFGLTEQQTLEAMQGIPVEIEVSKLLAGQDRAGFDQLLDIARRNPDASTLQEIRQQESERLLEIDYADALERYNDEDAGLEGFERAQRSVTEQLVAAGRTREEASAAGTLFGAVFRQLSAAGIDEQQVFESLGLRIEGPNTPARAPDVTLEDGTVYTAENIAELRRIAGETVPNRAQPLGAFVRSLGLNPSVVFEGEVGEIDTTGLIDRKGGLDLDVMAQRAAEEGYLPLDENGKADVQGFIDALAADYRAFQTGGERVTRPDDSSSVQAVRTQQAARALLEEVERAQESVSGVSDQESLTQAKAEGYEGEDRGEAREWLAAKAKGLDMSLEARMERARAMGFDVDTVLYHGTTHDFDEFSDNNGNPENHHGAGAYFTSDPLDIELNYASQNGQDLINRIERRSELLASELEYDADLRSRYGVEEDADFEAEAKQIAEKELRGNNQGVSIPVFVRLSNEVIVNGVDHLRSGSPSREPRVKSTFWEYESNYDEELDEYGEPEGPAIELIEAARNELNDLGFDQTDEVVGQLYEHVTDYGGIDADAFEQIMRGEPAGYVIDYEGSSGQIIQNVYNRLGHDGIRLEDADRQFPNMGMNDGTQHTVVFDPSNIRSVNAAFDPDHSDSANLLSQSRLQGYEGEDRGEAREWLAAVAKGLDMSLEARMARAEEQRFDTSTTLLHGTTAVFNNFEPSQTGLFGPGVYTTDDASYADLFAQTENEDGDFVGEYSETSQVIPVFARKGKYVTPEQFFKFTELFGSQQEAQRQLKLGGVLGVKDETQTLVFDVRDVRSVHAVFDPARTQSTDMLAQSPALVDEALLSSRLNPSRSAIARMMGEQKRSGKLPIVRLVQDGEGTVFAFDGSLYTHSQFMDLMGIDYATSLRAIMSGTAVSSAKTEWLDSVDQVQEFRDRRESTPRTLDQTREESFFDERLSPQENRIAEMWLNGFNTEQIADLDDTSVGTVKAVLSKARKKVPDRNIPKGKRKPEMIIALDQLNRKTPGLTSAAKATRLTNILGFEVTADRVDVATWRLKNNRTTYKPSEQLYQFVGERSQDPGVQADGDTLNQPSLAERVEPAAVVEAVQVKAEIEANVVRAAARCAAGGNVGNMVAGNLLGLGVGGTAGAIIAYGAGAEERRQEAYRYHIENLSSADLREIRAKSEALEGDVARRDADIAEATNRYQRALEAHYSDINNMPDDPTFDANGWAEHFTGIDASYLDALIGHEAGDDWDAQAVTSSATGGAQFISSTWRTWLSKYGAKYGEHPDPYSNDADEKQAALDLRNDRRWGTMIAAEFTRENVLFLQKELDRAVTGKEAYLAHFLGRDQALKMLQADPSSDAAAAFPREADSNRPVFYKGCSSFECDIDGLTPRTVKEVIAKQGRAFPGLPIFPYSEPTS